VTREVAGLDVCAAPAAADRLRTATAWLRRQAAGEPLLVLAPSLPAADDLLYRLLHEDARASADAVRATPPDPPSPAARFGWHRLTPAQLAGTVARAELARRDLVPVGPLGAQAAIARAIDTLRRDDALGRYAEVAGTPGFARAVAGTLEQLRLAGVSVEAVAAVDEPLAAVAQAFRDVLADAGLIDWPGVLTCAAERLEDGAHGEPLAGLPTLIIDPLLETPAEQRFLRALLQQVPDALVTLPPAAEPAELAARVATLSQQDIAMRVVDAPALSDATPASDLARMLARLQRELFARSGDERRADAVPAGTSAACGDEGTDAAGSTPDLFSTPAPAPAAPAPAALRVFSAPGESRECVEIVRALRDHAAAGIPFDQMAVVLRSPEQYRAHLEEAFARAGIPAWFARGALKPDPAGRAFLALLECRRSDLSARGFAEYLSLGELPDVAESAGAPPPAAAPDARWIAPDPEVAAIPGMAPQAQALDLVDPVAAQLRHAESEPKPAVGAAADLQQDRPEDGGGDGDAAVVDGRLRAPRRWERLLHDAAVIGGRDRWERRLDGLAEQLRLRIEALDGDGDDERRAAMERVIDEVAHLRAFALPLLDALAALPASAPWGEWLDALAALATRALRAPQRVLSVLSELRPMASIGPVTQDDVILVLSPRLLSLCEPPPRSRYGCVFVAPVEAVRGHAFDVVFVPGLAEKLFPRKIVEDPILLDEQRRALSAALETNDERVARERMALRLAVSAARREVVLSYPRIDMEQGRPRVASFYSLEAIRAAEGRLLDFQALASRAELQTRARLGWPAPDRPEQAIDEAEHDLALLDGLLRVDESRAVGAARYLLGANPHLGRALRFRARRWLRRWTPADGLIGPLGEDAAAALARHALDQRTYSPTALQNYAQCPYRFLLYAVHKLAPREVPVAIDEMDPLERGSLVHDVQFHLLTELSQAGRLPVTTDTLEAALEHLDAVLTRVSERYHDRLAPAIERVWADGISAIRADLREWLRLMCERDTQWVPWAFELAFGLAETAGERDPRSRPEGVRLPSGIQLRGAIDLIERADDGRLRVTDHKTGKKVAEKKQIIGGGEHLQPVLYAEVAEQLFAEQGPVAAGRLYYCTSRGGFADHSVPFDDEARRAARLVADTISNALSQQFLPAAPRRRRWSACTYCDYQVICGPYEEERVRRKPPHELEPLERLRNTP
jgi:ATP-dependent helicase/nuclease subunit B